MDTTSLLTGFDEKASTPMGLLSLMIYPCACRGEAKLIFECFDKSSAFYYYGPTKLNAMLGARKLYDLAWEKKQKRNINKSLIPVIYEIIIFYYGLAFPPLIWN